jgi:hypothetical protein
MWSEYIIDNGELAQLARAPALHAGGQRFESVILHIVHRNFSEGGQHSREHRVNWSNPPTLGLRRMKVL